MQVDEVKPKPLSSNIQASYQPVQPMYTGHIPQQQTVVQGLPVYGQQPMYQGQAMYVQPGYSQAYMGGQPIQMMYQPQAYNPQQVVVMQVVQINDRALLEERVRNAIKWFNGCNTVWGIYILINLITRCAALFGSEQSEAAQAAASFLIIENVVWLASIIVGIIGTSRFWEKYLLYYQYGLGLAMLFEVISSIIIFAGVLEGGTAKALMVIFFILTLLCLGSFIHHARQLRQAIIVLTMGSQPINQHSHDQG